MPPSTDPNPTPAGPGRRTISRNVAWAAPAILVASAAPAEAASTTPPPCPTCLTPGSAGAFTFQATTTSANKAALVGDITANIDARLCGIGIFKPAYTIVGTGATLTMSDGKTYTSPLSVTAGAGTLGQVSAFTSPVTFNGVNLPSGTYTLLGAPVRPVSMTVSFTAIFVRIALPPIQISCSYNLSYKVNIGAATGVISPKWLGGLGTVNFSGTISR